MNPMHLTAFAQRRCHLVDRQKKRPHSKSKTAGGNEDSVPVNGKCPLAHLAACRHRVYGFEEVELH